MPLYEYECGACGHRFETIQRFSDPPVDVCPACGKGPVNKLLSAPAFHFKGTGWYVTDYGRKGGAGSPPPAEPSSPAGDSKPDAKSKTPPTASAAPADPSKKND